MEPHMMMPPRGGYPPSGPPYDEFGFPIQPMYPAFSPMTPNPPPVRLPKYPARYEDYLAQGPSQTQIAGTEKHAVADGFVPV